MKVTIVIKEIIVTFGRNQKSRTCRTNITKSVARLVIKSETHAQNTRPTALPMLATPTILAATTAVTPTSSSKMGASCEIIDMPANVFKNRSNQSAYHCQVLSASTSVYSRPARCETSECVGVQPSGLQPSGGFCMNKAATTVTTKYAIPKYAKVLSTPTL